MSLWLAMAALVLVAGLIATRPWWRGARGAPIERRRANVAAYRSRLAELEAENAAGIVADGEARALKQELDARLVEDAERISPGSQSPAPGARRLVPALLVVTALAVFAGGWYGIGGSWRAAQTGSTEGHADLAEMVGKLADKLSREPDDPQGWAMLGRSYFVMQRYADAAKAYAEASARGKEPDPEWLTGEGEALAFARDRDLLGRPQQLFEHALSLDPDYGKALWYAGLAAVQAEDRERAKTLWTKLARQELPPQMREVLQAQLVQLGAAEAEVASPANPVEPATAAATAVELNIRVELAPALAARAPQDAVLFVFAKADGGPPMPLAVQRLPGAKLPVDIKLDDSMGMTPAMRLSQFERYAVTARLSRSGGAQAQSGDLEGSLRVARADAKSPLKLVIDRAVP